MSRVVLLGGSGFIGTRLAERLERRHQEFLIGDLVSSKRFPDRSRIVDVRSREAVASLLRADDTIVLLAAVHRDDVRPLSLYEETNVGGMRAVLGAMDDVGATRMVFTSSVAVYGTVSRVGDESTAPRPVNEYGRTKLLAEEVVREWHARDASRLAVILRPTVVFGEGNRGNVFNLLNAVAGRRYVMVGNGETAKSTAYVENVAAAIEWCMGLPPGLHLYNYVDEPDFTMQRLVELVRSLMGRNPKPTVRISRGVALALGRMADAVSATTGKRLPLSAVRVEKFTQSSAFSAARIRSAGFKPEVSLEDGLRRFILADFAGSG